MTVPLLGRLRRPFLQASSQHLKLCFPTLAGGVESSVLNTPPISCLVHEPGAPLSGYRPRIFSSTSASFSEAGLRQTDHNDEVTRLINMIRQDDWSRAMAALDSSSIQITVMHVVDVIRLEANPQYALRFFIWAGHQGGYVHDALAISAISRVWGHEKDFSVFLDVLANMHLDEYTMTPTKYLVLLRGYCWAGLTRDAISIMDWMIALGTMPDKRHFSCVLGALIKEKQFPAAENMLEKMKQMDAPLDATAYASLIDASCKVGCVQLVLKTFAEMLNNGIRPDAVIYEVIFNGLCKLGEVDKALKVYEEVKDIELETVALNTLMSGLCHHGHVDKALDFFNKTRPKADVKTYEILIAALCKAKNIKDARKYVEEALAKGFTFDAPVCKAFLESLCLACKDKEVCDLMNQLLSQCNVSDATYNMVISSLCRSGEVYSGYILWSDALRLKSLSSSTYEALLEGLCKEGRLTFSKRVYDDMMCKGFTLSVHVHGALMDAFCRAGNFDGAWKILNELLERGGSPNVDIFNSVIHGFSEAGQMAKAKQALQKMEDAGCFPILYTFVSLINGYCKVQMPENGLQLLRRMIAQDYKPDAGTVDNLIRACCRASKVDAAHMLFNDMKERGYKPGVQVYEALIRHLCLVENVDDARALLLELLERGIKPHRPVSDSVIQCLHKVSRAEDVRNLIEMLG